MPMMKELPILTTLERIPGVVYWLEQAIWGHLFPTTGK